MFTHLHVHTEYSLLDGYSRINKLVHRAKELQMDSIAITDHGNMYGAILFYKTAVAAGIKPIIGCEVYVAPESRFDRETVRGEDRYNHLILLAENDIGYHNLVKIVSKGFTEGYYYKPRVDKEVLTQYHEGIIALSACVAGEVASYIRKGFYEEAKQAALSLQSIFGENNFFLELQDHGLDVQKMVNQGILRIHQETGIPMVATNDCHYINKEDAIPHDILLCIQTGKLLKDENRMRYEGGQFYVKSEEEMKELFPYALEAVENTHKISERCNVEIVFGEQKVPQFDVPEGYDSVAYLRELCEQGFIQRYNQEIAEADNRDEKEKMLRERMEYELSVIQNMGFVDYFLIVWDYVNYARDNGIIVGPGRGSAAGSIVSYCLGITDVDPIRYDLLFERFLNPERVTMPDIDIDFCAVRRHEVIEYVTKKYGKEKVAQIIAFGTLASKMVIRDVGRVLDMPYAQVDKVAKMIPRDKALEGVELSPDEPQCDIARAFKVVPELKELYNSDTSIKHLLDMAMCLEGLPRHTSVHAAGVIIGAKALDEYIPLSKGAENVITSQYEKNEIEELGLLKMDFLSLRNLSVIQDAVSMIVRNTGEDLDITKIDITDEKVYDLISTGHCEGIFQLESSGMQSFMKELKPRDLDDIIAGIALYRPGPMAFIPKYIKGRDNPESIEYDCPQLEPILKSTYGCIVYQEQVMEIVRSLAGYSMSRSDLVRRVMSKKDAKAMERERQNFVYGNDDEHIDGCIKRGLDEKMAHHVFDQMITFAEYAFNKSHAVAYSYIIFQTAWLKCYYPVEYMASVLSSVLGNTTKISRYIFDCRQSHIPILPPDVNKGYGDFSADNGGIRYGLSAIKGIGSSIVEAIIKEREKRGEFHDLYDFAERLSSREVNKRTIPNLIKAGALDSFGATRKQLMQVYLKIIDSVVQEKKKRITGQMSLFDIMGNESQGMRITMPNCGEYDKDIKFAFEKEVMGVYVSGHPLEDDEIQMKQVVTATSLEFVVESEEESETEIQDIDAHSQNVQVQDNHKYVIGGIIDEISVKMTRRGDNMAIVRLEDLLSTVNVIVFPKQFELNKALLQEDKKVFIVGRADVSEQEAKLICENVIPFENVPKELWLQFSSQEELEKRKQELNELLQENHEAYQTSCPVIIYCRQEKQVIRLDKNSNVKWSTQFHEQLEQIYGSDNVRLKYKSIEKMR